MTQPTQPSTTYLDHLEAETRSRQGTAQHEESPFAGAPEAAATTVEARVDLLAPELSGLAAELHRDPETAYQEHRSARRIADLLEHHGVAARVGVHGLDTAVRAEAGSGSPVIAVMAEYDALPGIGHACGHNVIAAAGVGAFLALALTLQEEPNAFPGAVVLLGTPAEEGYSGKEVMARNGALDGVDAAVMVHPYGQDVVDQVWLGRRLLTVTFTGVAAHASAQPFMGRNALDAATLAYSGIGLLRQQLPPSDRVHAVITDGGARPSIVPERAEMKLYARSKYPESLRELSRRLEDVARGAALMTGTGVDLDWDEHPPSLPVRTNRALTGRWLAAQRRRGRQPLPGGVVSETLAASTDFGNISYRVPGIHPLIGISSPDIALHTREFADAAGSAAAGRAAVDGAAGLALTALDYLCDPNLQAAAAEEFAAAGGPVDVPGYFA
ncbi:M20 family metallopeptidase [Arthrobacter sp. Sa2CUA1]|uniref:Peptidase M20 domain-containing protein 2 n=1 Tax=Arthrobacter gallicola TaxID=2762225 RepID=A0ABR8UWJ7_9MICC|nr:M20 family metallopeptidase [Arthrobacter gallicola]MBD7996899.1 M20 family metallopeptidase [Arthrobacter gallicola]